jgi:hypothetical protein
MTTMVMKTRPSGQLTLRDKLSHLTFLEAAKLLGPDGKKLIQKSGNLWALKIEEHVHLGDDLFRLRIPGESINGQPVIVTITLMAEARNRLHWNCTACDGACEHVGAAFSLILEEKTPLGLAVAPPKRVAVASLSEEELIEKALAERLERAKAEKMKLEAADPARPWTDYTVTNRLTGKSYRVALRGLEPGESFCSCPDFRSNTLGTCKHVLHVIHKIRRKFGAAELRRPYRRKHIGLHLRYDRDVTLRWLLPDKMDDAVAKIVGPQRDRPIEDLHELIERLAKLQKLGHDWCKTGCASGWPPSAATPPITRCARRCLRRRSCRTSWMASPSPPAPAGPFWPTTWASAKPFRVLAQPSCWPARPISKRCSSCAQPRSSRNGAAKSIASASGMCNSSAGRRATVGTNTPTSASSPSATTSRCCATSCQSSA